MIGLPSRLADFVCNGVANPALKNGYISIATELVEVLSRTGIPGSEMRLVWVVWRKTWGWKDGDRHKDWDWISISQFEKATGIKHANVVKYTKSLVSKRILVKSEKGYKFNQNYDDWGVSKRIPRMQKDTTPSIQKDTKRGMQKDTNNRKKERVKETTLDAPQSGAGKEINVLIELFKEVNPSYEMLFRQKPQRAAIERMLKKWGIEKLESTIKALAGIINLPYAPKITTPCQLERDIGKLVAFYKQEKGKNKYTPVLI